MFNHHTLLTLADTPPLAPPWGYNSWVHYFKVLRYFYCDFQDDIISNYSNYLRYVLEVHTRSKY